MEAYTEYKERYPDIAFFLSFFPHKKKKLPTSPTSLLTWLKKNPLEEVEVLYLVGLIDFALPKEIVDWLGKKKERALVFIEEDLGAFASFRHTHLLEHAQIHLFYAQNGVDSLSEQFPTDRLAVYHEKPFDATALKRQSATISALYSDVLYSHKIMANVLANYGRLTNAFDARGEFENIPAIICGAGPSLDDSLLDLMQCRDKALLFAGGSAITALSKKQIDPHFALALDPNEEEFDRLRQNTFFEGPCLFAPRLNAKVFSTLNGPYGFLKTDTGGVMENWLEEQLGFDWDPIGPDLGAEAFSVTTLALAYALSLKCNPIIFLGVDLSFRGQSRYASGVEAPPMQGKDARALEQLLVRKDMHGNEVDTLLKWVMEAECISAYAKKQTGTQFFNASTGGLGFAHIPNRPLLSILSKACSKDLASMIHQWVHSSPLEFDTDSYECHLSRMHTSLLRCEANVSHLLCEAKKKKESNIFLLNQLDLEQEEAYVLLAPIDAAIKNLSDRYIPHIRPAEVQWERIEVRYKEIQRHIGLIKLILEKHREKACKKM